MKQIEASIQQHIHQHKHCLLPEQTAPRSSLSRSGHVISSTWNGITYRTFLEDRFFQPGEQIRVNVDQLTEMDKTGNFYLRQYLSHNHEFFEMFYVYSGRCISTIQGEELEFHAGDICLYSPLAIHSMRYPEEDDVIINILIRKSLFDHTFLNLVNNSDLVIGFFMDTLYNRKSERRYAVFRKEQTTIAKPIVLQMLYESIRHTSFSQDILRSYFVCLLADLTRCYEDSALPHSCERALSFKEVIQYIEQNCQTVTMDNLASEFGYSTRSMSAYIHKQSGRTFRDILKTTRLHQASQKLIKTQLPIEQIAAQTGYSHRGNFERSFHEVYHLTPAAYRKKYGNPSSLSK